MPQGAQSQTVVVQMQGVRSKAGAVKARGCGGGEASGGSVGMSGSVSEVWEEARGRGDAVRRARGAREHVLQRRRWRARRVGVGGGLAVQFWMVSEWTAGWGELLRTLQTTAAHRWHSATMSRAQRATRPLVSALPPAGRSAAPAPCACRSPASTSKSQCSVCRMSWSRYSRRLARNCLHVRDRSCSELRSSSRASWRTMLPCVVSGSRDNLASLKSGPGLRAGSRITAQGG